MDGALRLRRAQGDFGGEVFEPKIGGIKARELMEGHVIEGAANGGVHSLPTTADAALTLDAAATRRAAAFPDRYGPLEHVEDLGGGNVLRPSCEPVSSLGAARGNHHA